MTDNPPAIVEREGVSPLLPHVSKAAAEAGRLFDMRPEIAKWAMTCRAERMLIDGPVGTGKTRILLEKLRLCALKYPGSRHAILRRYRKWLTSAALVTFETKVLTGQELVPDRVQRENRSIYRFRNGSVIDVAGLDDPQNVMSREYDMIYLQEATEVSRAIADDVNGRLRNNVIPYQQLLMDCNPGPPKHWLKIAFENGWCERRPMRHADNPAMFNADGSKTKFGEAYLKRIEAYTGVAYRRKVLGEWVQSDGVVFDRWDSAAGIIPRSELSSPRFAHWNQWRRIWSIDFGYSHPFVWQEWAIDDDGRMYLVREIYKTGMLVEDAARWIIRLTAGSPKPEAIICDHDREDRATLERHLGMSTIPAVKDVQVGIDAVQSRMTPAGDGRPRLGIFEYALAHSPDEALEGRAHDTASSFDAYVWKKSPDGSIVKDDPVKEQDDGADCCRYAVMHLDHRAPAPTEGNYLALDADPTFSATFGRSETMTWV